MKSLVFGLCSLLALCAGAQTTPVYFNGLHYGGGQALGKKITVTPSAETLLQTDGTNVITGGPITLPGAAGGVVTNLWPGKYSVTIEGIGKGWTINVPPGWTNASPAVAARLSTNLVTFFPALFMDGAGITNMSWSAIAPRPRLLAWAMAGTYSMPTIQYDQNDTATNATVLWPDGTYGIWTATNINSTWFTPDGYTITYTNPTMVVAQPTMLRDQKGNVTNAPVPLIYP